MGTRSILPNSEPRILQPIVGPHGTFQVRWLGDDADIHGLFFQENGDTYWTLLAGHHNGYSCENLAQRVLKHWSDEKPVEYVLDQFRYILACGGLGRNEATILYVAQLRTPSSAKAA